MILLLILLLVAQLPLSMWLMWRSPYNLVSIVGVLTTIFSYLPAVIYLAGYEYEFYSWRVVNFLVLDDAQAINVAFFIGVMNLFLLLGAVGAEVLHGENLFSPRAGSAVSPRGTSLYGSGKVAAFGATYFAIWFGVAVSLFVGSGQPLTEFLLPIKETGIAEAQSGYLRSIYLMMPAVLLVLTYWKYGGRRFVSWICIFLAVVATFSTHQRRALVTTVLLVLGAEIFLGQLYRSAGLSASKRKARLRKYLAGARFTTVGIFIVGLVMVPVLWYARVYFTSRQVGSDVNVFEIRSFVDILFGSPATGFPTFVLIDRFVEEYGTNPIYLLTYPLTIFIPRSLWESKPVDLDGMLQYRYMMRENPSSFWFGELFYGVGYLAPLVALVAAFFLYRFCLKCQRTPNVWSRTLGALLFMQSITLFKNGISVFFINLLVPTVFLGVVWFVCRSTPARKGVGAISPRHSF